MNLRNVVLATVLSIPALAMWQHDAHPQEQSEAKRLQWNELVGSINNMHHVMSSIEPSGDVDIDFVRLMLPHHQAALDMAKTQLLYRTDPQMRRLAQETITDQQSEIDLMQLRLKQHNVQQTPADHPAK